LKVNAIRKIRDKKKDKESMSRITAALRKPIEKADRAQAKESAEDSGKEKPPF
jgi:hypothetical protein